MANGGGLCAVCGARQGAYDPAIDLPRCTGLLAHPMYYHVPVKRMERVTVRVGSDVPQDTVLFVDHRGRLAGAITNLNDEYQTADRPQSKRNPSWTF